MSKLEELIQRYCPDGVEYKPLGEICKPLHKGTLTTKELVEPDGSNYPVINSGRELYGYYPQFNNEGDAFTVAARGEYAGYITYFSERFWAGGLCYPYRSNSPVILTKFVFYCLKTKQDYIRHTQVAEGRIPALNKGTLDLFEIPIPPLPVQEEIVRVLDTFTELQAELQAELQKRLQQYNYYRDKLLSFEGRTDVEWKRLGDICKKVCSGGTPSRGNGDYFKGNIPWLRTQEVDWSDIYDTEIKITEGAVKKSSAKLIPENCVIVAMYGATAGKAAINKIPLTTNQACCNLQIDSNKALYKYVYYCVCNEYEHIKALGQGSQNNINAQIVKDYLIPVPPLAEQQRIVDILDRFDSLTNDLTAGLPAEIEKRRQQYEFYRDKLLTFKRKEA